VNSHAKDILGS